MSLIVDIKKRLGDFLLEVSFETEDRVTGLLGPSGCGKSTLTDSIRAAGFRCVDADQVAREVLLPGSPCIVQLQQEFGADIVDEAGQARRRLIFRFCKYLLHGTVSQNPAAVHDTEPGTEMVGLIPAVCDHDSPAVQGAEEVFEFRLKLILQIAVQSGKRLVQQKEPWPAGQDSGESRSLGLPP